MLINGKHYRTIWIHPDDPRIVQIIDQRRLPHELVVEDLRTLEDASTAIRDMHVRGAPLIGSTAAYGLYLASLAYEESQGTLADYFTRAIETLKATRPTAVDLFNVLARMRTELEGVPTIEQIRKITRQTAEAVAEESVEACRKIGEYGLPLIEEISKKKDGQPVNILTHCNAGWMACIDYGTATSPIYQAYNAGIPVHVWVDETRPRNQGARITAFELLQHGVPHTIITDNAGGLLMQKGEVDLVIVGTDRTTAGGDVANKIGTYLKALAAKDNDVPFYVALPSSSIDWSLEDGRDVPIEERSAEEVKYIQGLHEGKVKKVLLTPSESPALNYGFDITPRHLVTGLITERGICSASKEALQELFF